MGIILASIAALSLLAVGVSAVGRQRSAETVVLFLAAALLAGIELCDQVSLHPSVDFGTFRRMALSLEALLPAALLLLGTVYGRSRPFATLSKVLFIVPAALALFPPALLIVAGTELYYSPDVLSEGVLFLGGAGYWFYISLMVSFVVALANVETTLSATRGTVRNRMKFEAFGIMSLLAVLIFYYSQGLLYRTINLNLIPVRSSVFIIAALLIGYSRTFRGTEARVSISRHILYRSIALLVVGVYLLGLGLIGEGMRYFGDTFGRQAAIVLAFAGGVLLLAVLFSEKARRTTKVYISKHFYAHKHDYREEWIKFTTRLSSCATLAEVQESVLLAYRETFGLAGALLYLRKDDRKFSRASGHGTSDSPADLSISDDLHDYFVRRARVLNLSDGEYRPSSSEAASFKQAGAWLVVPLISNEKIEGLMIFRDQIVPEKLIYEDFDLMKVLARQAAQAVANLRLSEENMEMRAMAAVSRISAFVLHDLKNLTTGLSLVVDNAEEHIGNPEFQQDAIGTIRNTLVKMKGLIQRLKSIPEKITLISKVEDIDRLSRKTVEELASLRPGRRIVYTGAPAFSCVDGDEIKKVIVNLVQNGLEACDEQGTVAVETRREHGRVLIRVSDTGGGMTDDFMKNHLFKPFRTTKEKGLGIGLYQCRQIVEAHDGRLEARSEVGKGSVFSISLHSVDEVSP